MESPAKPLFSYEYHLDGELLKHAMKVVPKDGREAVYEAITNTIKSSFNVDQIKDELDTIVYQHLNRVVMCGLDINEEQS